MCHKRILRPIESAAFDNYKTNRWLRFPGTAFYWTWLATS
jgi:hypothetical protein